jgi:hypothetical protein
MAEETIKRKLHLWEQVFNDKNELICLVKDHPAKEKLSPGGICDGNYTYCDWAKEQDPIIEHG